MANHGIMVGVGLLSLGVALLIGYGPSAGRGAGGLAGLAFLLIAPLQTLRGMLHGRARRRLDARLAAAAPDTAVA